MQWVGILTLALAATVAHAEQPAVQGALALQSPSIKTRTLLIVDEPTKNDVPFIRLAPPARLRVGEERPQLQINQGAVVPSATPVSLQIEPLAGHLGEVSTLDVAGHTGFTTSIANNVLGVGITQAYGFALSQRVTVSPYVALDYNRVDSTRLINFDSPRPFTNDNADTGLAAALGIAVEAQMSNDNRVAPTAFASVVFGSDSQNVVPREASSVGARIIQSIGSNGPEVMWSEVGTGVAYRVSPQSQLRAAVVQTFGRPSGDTVSAQLVWRTRW